MKNYNENKIDLEILQEKINTFKYIHQIETLEDELDIENGLESLLNSIEINKEVDYSNNEVVNTIYLICNYKNVWDPVLEVIGDLLFQRILVIVNPSTYDELENIFKQIYPSRYKSICQLSYIIAYYKTNYPLKTYVGYLNCNLDIIKEAVIFKRYKQYFKIDEKAMEYSDMHTKKHIKSKINEIRSVFDDIKKHNIGIIYDENNNSSEFGILDNYITIPSVLLDEEIVNSKNEKLSKYKLSLLKKQCKWYNDNMQLVKDMEIYEYDDNTSGYVLNIDKMKEWYIANGEFYKNKKIQKYFEEEKYIEGINSLKFIKGDSFITNKNHISYDNLKSKQDKCIVYKNKILLSKNIIEISKEKSSALSSYNIINGYVEDIISRENKGMQ